MAHVHRSVKGWVIAGVAAVVVVAGIVWLTSRAPETPTTAEQPRIETPAPTPPATTPPAATPPATTPPATTPPTK